MEIKRTPALASPEVFWNWTSDFGIGWRLEEMKTRGFRLSLLVALMAAVLISAPAYAQHKPAKEVPESGKNVRQLNLGNKVLMGDFDKMLERRLVRIVLPYSRTLFFNDKGRERGLAAELARDFEHFLNKKYAKKLGKRPLTVVLIPRTRDALLTDVVRGMADIAIGNLTVTEERQKIVDFVASEDMRRISEILVTGPKSAVIQNINDLAGRTVHVRKASSYYESIVSLNARFQKEGKRQVKIVLVPDALEDEDMMEMLNAGLFEYIVVDDWKAKLWAQILPKIKPRHDIVLRSEGRTGWAIRKGSPQLEKEIREAANLYVKKMGVMEARLANLNKKIKQIKDPTRSSDWKRFEQIIALFRKYGEKYNFDPLMLAAQGYQESMLNQNKRSHVGAIGVMQIMPATGTEMKVGKISVTENNIHAGTKYMDQIMSKYFPDAKFDEMNRTLFAFASYNAGPGRISSMRRLAEQKGFDPYKWFNNVEVVTAQKVGIETTTYVRNIFKYYAAYKLLVVQMDEQRKAREQVEAGRAK